MKKSMTVRINREYILTSKGEGTNPEELKIVCNFLRRLFSGEKDIKDFADVFNVDVKVRETGRSRVNNDAE